jgi:hypothetical protein
MHKKTLQLDSVINTLIVVIPVALAVLLAAHAQHAFFGVSVSRLQANALAEQNEAQSVVASTATGLDEMAQQDGSCGCPGCCAIAKL